MLMHTSGSFAPRERERTLSRLFGRFAGSARDAPLDFEKPGISVYMTTVVIFGRYP
jgi:hypothetical protein